MSVTEEIFARLGLEENYSSFIASGIGTTRQKKQRCKPSKPYYNAIETSSSSLPVCRITVEDFTEKRRYQPRTALGARLIAIRERAIAKGLKLLDADEIIEEIRKRRGEFA